MKVNLQSPIPTSFYITAANYCENNAGMGTKLPLVVTALRCSLVPRPLLPRGDAWYILLAHAEIFSVKSFVHFLVRMRTSILTKNTELSLN